MLFFQYETEREREREKERERAMKVLVKKYNYHENVESLFLSLLCHCSYSCLSLSLCVYICLMLCSHSMCVFLAVFFYNRKQHKSVGGSSCAVGDVPVFTYITYTHIFIHIVYDNVCVFEQLLQMMTRHKLIVFTNIFN